MRLSGRAAPACVLSTAPCLRVALWVCSSTVRLVILRENTIGGEADYRRTQLAPPSVTRTRLSLWRERPSLPSLTSVAPSAINIL
jgi:hypothetical protein